MSKPISEPIGISIGQPISELFGELIYLRTTPTGYGTRPVQEPLPIDSLIVSPNDSLVDWPIDLPIGSLIGFAKPFTDRFANRFANQYTNRFGNWFVNRLVDRFTNGFADRFANRFADFPHDDLLQWDTWDNDRNAVQFNFITYFCRIWRSIIHW